MALNLHLIYKSILVIHRLKVKEFLRWRESTLRLAHVNLCASLIKNLTLSFYSSYRMRTAYVFYNDSDKPIMFNDLFSFVFELDDGSEPVFYGSVTNVLDDVLHIVFDISNMLYKVDVRFTLTLDGIPSILCRSFSTHTYFSRM